MPSAAPRLRVARPPERPFVLYDGECRFCGRWATRWQNRWGRRLLFGSSQFARVRFPEIPAAAYDDALQLVEPDGTVYAGAEAALRACAHGRGWRGFLLPAYESLPGAARLMEFGYRIVARNRRVFSMLIS